jgi:hypothetical protein
LGGVVIIDDFVSHHEDDSDAIMLSLEQKRQDFEKDLEIRDRF